MSYLKNSVARAAITVGSFSLLLGLAHCGAEDQIHSQQDEERGVFALPPGTKADEPTYSCKGHCASAFDASTKEGKAPGGCFCDDACASWGDCCLDKQVVCSCPQLSPPGPGFCPNGKIVPKYDAQQICVVGYNCETCPQLSPPGPGFCPNGKIVPKYDAQEVCIVGYGCVTDPCAGRLYDACVVDPSCEFVVNATDCPPCPDGQSCECSRIPRTAGCPRAPSVTTTPITSPTSTTTAPCHQRRRAAGRAGIAIPSTRGQAKADRFNPKAV